MMKIKIKLTFINEFEVDPSLYDDGLSLEDMLNVEITNAKEDPYLMCEDATMEVSGELIGE